MCGEFADGTCQSVCSYQYFQSEDLELGLFKVARHLDVIHTIVFSLAKRMVEEIV